MTSADAPSPVAADGPPIPPESWPGGSWPGATGPAPRRPADLDEAALAELTLRPRHHVAPAAKRLWALVAVLGWLVVLVPLSVWILVDGSHRTAQALAFGGILLVALAHTVCMPMWRYRIHRWEVSDEAVYTQSGWLHQQKRVAPISRIQTVDSEFGPLERLFDLGTLTVTTASAAGPLRVSGLERTTVRRLVDELTRVTATTPGDAT